MFPSNIKVSPNFLLNCILGCNYCICTIVLKYILQPLYDEWCVFFGKYCNHSQDRGIKEEILWLQVAKQHTSGSYEGQVDNNCKNQEAFPLSASSSANPALLEIPWFTSKSLSWASKRGTKETAELLKKYSTPFRKVTVHFITVLAFPSSFRAHFHSAQFPDTSGASCK